MAFYDTAKVKRGRTVSTLIRFIHRFARFGSRQVAVGCCTKQLQPQIDFTGRTRTIFEWIPLIHDVTVQQSVEWNERITDKRAVLITTEAQRD